MEYKQLKTPNLNINATVGWCLQYIDDSINAPKRMPSATAAWLNENRNGSTSTNLPPDNLWVTIFFKLSNEPNGHIAWYKKTNGLVTIADSNQRATGKPFWNSIAAIRQALRDWIGGTAEYLGWSRSIDGIQMVEVISNDNNSNINQEEEPMLYTLTTTYRDLKEGETYLVSGTVAEHVGDATQYDALVNMFGTPKKIDAGSLWQFGRFDNFDVYKAGKKLI